MQKLRGMGAVERADYMSQAAQTPQQLMAAEAARSKAVKQGSLESLRGLESARQAAKTPEEKRDIEKTKSIVKNNANSWKPAELAETSKELRKPSTSTATNLARPVKFKHTSITVTATNIKNNVEIVTPACDRPSKIFIGLARKDLSTNIRISRRNTAHHPAALASPAAFWNSSMIQGKDVISHVPFLLSTTAPSMIEYQLRPTASLAVSRRTRTNKTGPKICIK